MIHVSFVIILSSNYTYLVITQPVTRMIRELMIRKSSIILLLMLLCMYTLSQGYGLALCFHDNEQCQIKLVLHNQCSGNRDTGEPSEETTTTNGTVSSHHWHVDINVAAELSSGPLPVKNTVRLMYFAKINTIPVSVLPLRSSSGDAEYPSCFSNPSDNSAVISAIHTVVSLI